MLYARDLFMFSNYVATLPQNIDAIYRSMQIVQRVFAFQYFGYNYYELLIIKILILLP